jgi:uncharacterized protein YPO0396
MPSHDPDEIFEKLTEERDALRSAVEMAMQEIRRAQEAQKQAEERAVAFQVMASARRAEIDMLRQKISDMETENRRMRQLVVAARSRPVESAQAPAPGIDPFSGEDPEPEYSS